MSMNIIEVKLARTIKFGGFTADAFPGRDSAGAKQYTFAIQTPFIRIAKTGHKPKYIPLANVVEVSTDEPPEAPTKKEIPPVEYVQPPEPAVEAPAAAKKPGKKPKPGVNG